MKTLKFSNIYQIACDRKGGEGAVEALLPGHASKRTLKKLGSDRYLAEFTRKIFQSGFVWRVVDQKWANFETLFWGFDVEKLLLMPDDMLERKARDPDIIRNHRKVCTIRNNAMMIGELERREGRGFGAFIADWPDDNIVGLWAYLKKHGDRLGGNTGPYALRALGVDTFLLTRDVEGFLRNHGIVDTGIGSRKALESSQAFFNEMRDQSGRSLSQLSRIVAMCHGENRLGMI
jgi:3-methyladenine DNA glycosylase Tag